MPPTPTDALTARAAAATGPDRQRALAELAARTRKGADAVRAFNALLATPDGLRIALEYVAAVPEPVPRPLVLLAAQSLSDPAPPVALRLVVAGALLASVPDTPAGVGPIVRAVTAELSRSKSVQRMLELQSRVEACATLDAMTEQATSAVKLKCPKCPEQLPRDEFVPHLWHRHRLGFEGGVATDPRPMVEAAVQAATADDPAAADRAFALTAEAFPASTPEQVLEAVSARQVDAGYPVPDSLTRPAADAHAGLCPNCLAQVPDPVPPPPPPLAVSRARIAGDGFAIEVVDASGGRTVHVVTPKAERSVKPDGRRFHPRALAVFVAVPLLVAFAGVAFIPGFDPVLTALGGCALGWGLYAAVRFTRRGLPPKARVVLDTAWAEVVPGLKLNRTNARWLARLCRASVGKGTPIDRARTVNDLVENAAEQLDKGGPYLPLFAAARLLQVSDGADTGRERTGGLVGIFEPFFRGELTAEYAETAAEIARTDDHVPDADAARLGVRLLASAFEAGFYPVDLLRILRFLPHLRVLCGTPAADYLKMAYSVWRWRTSEPWSTVGGATAVFVLADGSPGPCKRLLAAHPDALLRITLPDGAEAELGEVALTPRGVAAGGKVLSDPDAEAELVRSSRGSGWVLAIGGQRISLDRKLSDGTINLLLKWVKYRVNKLIPHAETQDRTDPGRVKRALLPLVRACKVCGTESVCRSGRVGDRWPVG